MSKKPRRNEYTMSADADEMRADERDAAQDVEEAVTAPPAEPVLKTAPNPLPEPNPSGKFGVVLITTKLVRLFVAPGGGWLDYDTALEWSKTRYSEGEMYHVIAIEVAS